MKKANGVGLIINQPSLVHCHLIGRITLRMTVIINIAKSSQPLKQSPGKDTFSDYQQYAWGRDIEFSGKWATVSCWKFKVISSAMTALRDRTESNIKYEPASMWRVLICLHNLCMGTEYLGIIKGSSPCFAQGRLSLFLWFSLATRIPYLKPCIRRYFLPDFGDG